MHGISPKHEAAPGFCECTMPCQNVQHELNLDYDFPTALLSRGPTFKFVISLEMELLVLSIYDFGEIAFIS